MPLSFNQEATSWILANFDNENLFFQHYALQPTNNQDRIIANRIAQAMIVDAASREKFHESLGPVICHQVVKYYRHFIYFMQHNDLKPWSTPNVSVAFALARQLTEVPTRLCWNGIDETGNNTDWFEKMLHTKTWVTYTEILDARAALESLFRHLPADEELRGKLTSYYEEKLKAGYDAPVMYGLSPETFWREKLMHSKMEETYADFIELRKVLTREIELTWGEILLYGKDAFRCLMASLEKVANNRALNEKLNVWREDAKRY